MQLYQQARHADETRYREDANGRPCFLSDVDPPLCCMVSYSERASYADPGWK